MSMTQSIGVVGPSHWSFMAATLSEIIAKAAHSKRIPKNAVPKGILVDAKEFFQLVSQANHEGVPENPPASINAYVIATGAIRHANRSQSGTQEAIRSSLNDYASFLDRLEIPRRLTNGEITTAKSLQKFFHQLYLDGESEAYERAIK